MTETRMPKLRGDNNDMTTSRHAMWNGVEVPIAIAPKKDRLGLEILNRKTRGVKLNRTVIVASKLLNG
jgi:hypothetical protein